MVRIRLRPGLIPPLLSTALCFFLAARSSAQTQKEVRQAFIDIRDDHIKWNCARATYWLFQRREALKDQMLEELYRTNDAQARDALLFVLISTKSLSPDDRFSRFLLQRIRTGDLKTNLSVPNDAPVSDKQELASRGDPVWVFINGHYDVFEPLLKAGIGETDSVYELWATAWLMKKRGVLAENTGLFTDDVLRKAGAALKDDRLVYNASQAARLFLLLPEKSLPILKELTKSIDRQQSSLARALIDAISNGTKDAFGFICWKCRLDIVLFGNPVPEPPWLDELVARCQEADRQTYP